jgi:glycosyltransferase involved in cell wall biosynthesis
MEALVSIIIPVYNCRQYLEKCLSSVIGQTYKNIEILIIDDGSTDGSNEIIKQNAHNDQRIKSYFQNKSGTGRSRNVGLFYSKGEFVMFVDADDWLEPRAVELLCEKMINKNADLVCCGFNKIINGHKIATTPDIGLNSIQDYLTCCLNESENTREKIITTIWAKLFSNKLLKQHLISFKLERHDDTPFVIETVYNSNKIVFIDKVLYNYLVRPESLSNQKLSKHKLENLYNADYILKQFLQDKHIYAKYKEQFARFHLSRIILYGGYGLIYLNTQNNLRDENYPLFFHYLKKDAIFFSENSAAIFPGLSGLRFRMLKFALSIGTLNVNIPHKLFYLFELTLRKLARRS